MQMAVKGQGYLIRQGLFLFLVPRAVGMRLLVAACRGAHRLSSLRHVALQQVVWQTLPSQLSFHDPGGRGICSGQQGIGSVGACSSGAEHCASPASTSYPPSSSRLPPWHNFQRASFGSASCCTTASSPLLSQHSAFTSSLLGQPWGMMRAWDSQVPVCGPKPFAA